MQKLVGERGRRLTFTSKKKPTFHNLNGDILQVAGITDSRLKIKKKIFWRESNY